jgi:hypothetical protein
MGIPVNAIAAGVLREQSRTRRLPSAPEIPAPAPLCLPFRKRGDAKNRRTEQLIDKIIRIRVNY